MDAAAWPADCACVVPSVPRAAAVDDPPPGGAWSSMAELSTVPAGPGPHRKSMDVRALTEGAAVPKNTAILLDGTSGGISANRTNVLRLYGTPEKSQRQPVHYDPAREGHTAVSTPAGSTETRQHPAVPPALTAAVSALRRHCPWATKWSSFLLPQSRSPWRSI